MNYAPKPGDTIVHTSTGETGKVISLVVNKRRDAVGVRARFYRWQFPRPVMLHEIRKATVLEAVVYWIRKRLKP